MSFSGFKLDRFESLAYKKKMSKIKILWCKISKLRVYGVKWVSLEAQSGVSPNVNARNERKTLHFEKIRNFLIRNVYSYNSFVYTHQSKLAMNLHIY